MVDGHEDHDPDRDRVPIRDNRSVETRNMDELVMELREIEGVHAVDSDLKERELASHSTFPISTERRHGRVRISQRPQRHYCSKRGSFQRISVASTVDFETKTCRQYGSKRSRLWLDEQVEAPEQSPVKN